MSIIFLAALTSHYRSETVSGFDIENDFFVSGYYILNYLIQGVDNYIN